MSELILLKSYYHKHEAEMAIGLLKNNGIDALLQADDVGGFRPHVTLGMGNCRVMIQEKDAKRAIEVIKTLEEEFSPEQLREIEEWAIEKKQAPQPSLKEKVKSHYSIAFPLIIGALFIYSYVNKGIPEFKYPAVIIVLALILIFTFIFHFSKK